MGMARSLRFIPDGGSLVHITCRTMQGRYLFCPNPELNETLVGVLGQAQALHPVRICQVAVLSNHLHLLLDVDDACLLAGFMEYFNGNLAKEVNRLTGWEGPVFARRYTSIIVSNEEKEQVAIFRYIAAQGVKEGLVEKVRDWPGVHSLPAILDGEPLKGYWFSRTQEYAARRRRESFDRYDYATEVTVHLAPLPCWKGLSPEQYRRRVAALETSIEEEAAREREKTGEPVLGAEAVVSRDPHHRPEKMDRSPAPRFHTATEAAWRLLYDAYSEFLAAFRTAGPPPRSSKPAIEQPPSPEAASHPGCRS